ncbi:nucleotidyltransferase domain-containing protein [Leptolyngbya sp. BC1307]|uniref:nucleotidyltransferase domain-containing protein n=1 Tax=Leptolyngbya sp. BC1307 TaxID=2029589 RepID=UPI0014839E1B|nr:nucleotidyltransferase domain-containing protein [Leptolyngbya sp. BC1307]
MKWPNRHQVHTAISQWVRQLGTASGTAASTVLSAGYFGSYARDDAGVGSDLDVVIIVTESNLPFNHRYNLWDFSTIPVPVEAQVYTVHEWEQLPTQQPRFYKTLVEETCWIKQTAAHS